MWATLTVVPLFLLQVVKRALYLCLDRSQREQEVMACLLSSLHVNGAFTVADIMKVPCVALCVCG